MATATQLCTFYLDDQLFGVPVAEVQEVIRYQRMTPVPLAGPEVRGLINLRGQIVTALDLRQRVGIAHNGPARQPMNVVIRSDGDVVSLLVDEIGDVQTVDEADFDPVPTTIPEEQRRLVRGAYKLDGQLLLLLNSREATAPC